MYRYRVDLSQVAKKNLRHYPFKNGELVLMLGEIKHMEGHVAVVTRGGKVEWGWHDDIFKGPLKEED